MVLRTMLQNQKPAKSWIGFWKREEMQVSSDVPVVKQFSWGLAIRGVLELSELQSFVENRKDFGKSVEKLCNMCR